jgi:hypothetical protein
VSHHLRHTYDALVGFATPADAALDSVRETDPGEATVVAQQVDGDAAVVLIHVRRQSFPEVVVVCRRDQDEWDAAGSGSGSGRRGLSVWCDDERSVQGSVAYVWGRAHTGAVEVVLDDDRIRITPPENGYWLWARAGLDEESWERVVVRIAD